MHKMPPIIRFCFSRIWNKQFLIFLFFLALSATFWIFQTLNETYECEFRVPVELRGAPSNVVVTTEFPPTMQVTLRDKGIALLTYRFTRKLSPVTIDFNAYSNSSGHIVVQASEVLKQISSQLLSSTQLLTLKPETMSLYYNYGERKRVPVVVRGSVHTAHLYALAATILSTDSVTVYASKEQLDTITAAYTVPLNLTNLADTTHINVELAKTGGVKFVPAAVGATFCIDRLVEKTVQVPVQQVNFPATKQLRTFPASVNVTFQVTMGLYRTITRENFVLVVNYEELLKSKGNRCHLSLKTIPAGVSHVRISPQDVEYVIEEITETDSDSEPF